MTHSCCQSTASCVWSLGGYKDSLKSTWQHSSPPWLLVFRASEKNRVHTIITENIETWWVLKSLIHKLLTYWLKLVPLKCGSSRKFPLEVLVNVRGLIMVWIDCKDTSVISTSRQTLLRRPLQLALTKTCSSVQPLQEEEITSTLLGLKCVRRQHKRTSILKWPITDTFRCFRNFKAQITACLTDLHQHINTVEKIF